MARGYFGIGIENWKKGVNIGTLWRSAYCLGASFIFTIGDSYKEQASDTNKSWRHIPLFQYNSVNEFIMNYPQRAQIVGVEIKLNSQPLKDFKHPERAVYVLGPENGSISEHLLNYCDHVVQIDSKYCLNVSVAGSIVMYDRQIKS